MKMPIMIVMNHLTKRNKNKRKIAINLLCQITTKRKIDRNKDKDKIKMLINNNKGKVNNK